MCSVACECLIGARADHPCLSADPIHSSVIIAQVNQTRVILNHIIVNDMFLQNECFFFRWRECAGGIEGTEVDSVPFERGWKTNVLPILDISGNDGFYQKRSNWSVHQAMAGETGSVNEIAQVAINAN
jgi:hypothetical protein